MVLARHLSCRFPPLHICPHGLHEGCSFAERCAAANEPTMSPHSAVISRLTVWPRLGMQRAQAAAGGRGRGARAARGSGGGGTSNAPGRLLDDGRTLALWLLHTFLMILHVCPFIASSCVCITASVAMMVMMVEVCMPMLLNPASISV